MTVFVCPECKKRIEIQSENYHTEFCEHVIAIEELRYPHRPSVFRITHRREYDFDGHGIWRISHVGEGGTCEDETDRWIKSKGIGNEKPIEEV